jgi:HrpA-like RNA helicase
MESVERMARTLGERAGETVGYRVRFGSKISRATRIEVVTEGIFSRQILDDPELTGVAAVLFDEFHERSLDADLGLALARDAQTGLREDLRILVMSATLDGARVGNCFRCAVVERRPRFPVETRYLGRDAHPVHATAARCAPIRKAWCSCRRGETAAETWASASRSSSMWCALRRSGEMRTGHRAGAQAAQGGAGNSSPRARSPSRVCAWSSIAGWRGCRATSPTWA